MSQIELNFARYLSFHPEVEECYGMGLINRRAFARLLVKQGIAPAVQMDGVVAMLRRYPFKQPRKGGEDQFRDTKISLKDGITVLDFVKEKGIMHSLQQVINCVDFDKGDTLKIVVGTASVKLFIDEENEKKIKPLMLAFKPKHHIHKLAELSMNFPDAAIRQIGIISTITRELALNGIVITECLTASPELLIYLAEEHVLKAYQIIKQLGRPKVF